MYIISGDQVSFEQVDKALDSQKNITTQGFFDSSHLDPEKDAEIIKNLKVSKYDKYIIRIPLTRNILMYLSKFIVNQDNIFDRLLNQISSNLNISLNNKTFSTIYFDDYDFEDIFDLNQLKEIFDKLLWVKFTTTTQEFEKLKKYFPKYDVKVLESNDKDHKCNLSIKAFLLDEIGFVKQTPHFYDLTQVINHKMNYEFYKKWQSHYAKVRNLDRKIQNIMEAKKRGLADKISDDCILTLTQSYGNINNHGIQQRITLPIIQCKQNNFLNLYNDSNKIITSLQSILHSIIKKHQFNLNNKDIENEILFKINEFSKKLRAEPEKALEDININIFPEIDNEINRAFEYNVKLLAIEENDINTINQFLDLNQRSQYTYSLLGIGYPSLLLAIILSNINKSTNLDFFYSLAAELIIKYDLLIPQNYNKDEQLIQHIPTEKKDKLDKLYKESEEIAQRHRQVYISQSKPEFFIDLTYSK